MARAKTKTKPKRQAKKKQGATKHSASGGIKLDPEELRQDIREAGGGNYFSWPDSGKAKIRLIPYEHNGRAKLFFKQVQHWEPVPGTKGVMCGGHDCGLCQLRASADDEDLKKHLRPRIQYLFNIVDKADKNEKVQSFRAGKTLYDKFVTVVQDTEEFPGACDYEDGVDFLITKKGQGLKTEYDSTPAQKRSDVSPTGSITNFDEQANNRESVDTKEMARSVADAFSVDVPF